MPLGQDSAKNTVWYKSRGRALIFALLSALFYDHLTMERISRLLVSPDLKSFFSEISMIRHPLARQTEEGVTGVIGYLSRVGRDEELRLQKEFARLFLLPGGVYPYESIYRGTQQLLMDKPWEEVRKTYRSLGLEKDSSEFLPEDHIAVELGFVASLAYMTSEARGRALKDLQGIQLDFLSEHLEKWVPHLAADIREKSGPEEFYHMVAQVLQDLLELDKVALSGGLEPVSI